jgi:integral membrane protein
MTGGTASGSGHARDERAKEVRRVRLNVTLYRLMAYVTGVVLIVLCVLAIMQAFVNDEAAVSVVGQIHGGLYIVYLLVAFSLCRRLRLPPGPTVVVLLAGTIPVMTFIVERWVSHRYIEPALAGGTAAPNPPVPERRS